MAINTAHVPFDPEARRAELIERFRALEPQEARRQIAVLPYYHLLENEITRPNRGIFVTDYFLTRWAPTLAMPATGIVLALRKLANKDGKTFASLDTIARTAGVGRTTLTLWLSTSEARWDARRPDERERWLLLHRYFLRSKARQYLIRREGAMSRAKRTTNLYQIAMDDPVHPEDEAKLFALAAERMVNDEAELARNAKQDTTGPYTVAPRPYKTGKVIIRESDAPDPVDNQPYTVAPRPHVAGRTATGLSSSYRIVTDNVRETDRPRIATVGMSETDRARKEALAMELGEQLKLLAGDRDLDLHKSAGFHRRIAYLMPEHLIREALAAVKDAAQEARSGRLFVHRGYGAYFAGIIQKIAQRERIDLGVEWTSSTIRESR